MNIKYPLACAALLASILSCPIAAEDTTPIAEEIHNRIAYGTPTIDGYLDSAYMQSERIDYKLTTELSVSRQGYQSGGKRKKILQLGYRHRGVHIYAVGR